jgi:mRNA-degrading endonuclease RelE of RelBE toxin-antitoxin system
MIFEVEVSESALEDLQFLKKAERNVVFDALQDQLATEPLKQTRNRKPLRANELSAWEMRVGAFRVFDDVDEEASKVTVRAEGCKEHNKLYIRGEEYKL